jgi:hypothetical protein
MMTYPEHILCLQIATAVLLSACGFMCLVDVVLGCVALRKVTLSRPYRDAMRHNTIGSAVLAVAFGWAAYLVGAMTL